MGEMSVEKLKEIGNCGTVIKHVSIVQVNQNQHRWKITYARVNAAVTPTRALLRTRSFRSLSSKTLAFLVG
jgi:hypothetical protein